MRPRKVHNLFSYVFNRRPLKHPKIPRNQLFHREVYWQRKCREWVWTSNPWHEHLPGRKHQSTQWDLLQSKQAQDCTWSALNGIMCSFSSFPCTLSAGCHSCVAVLTYCSTQSFLPHSLTHSFILSLVVLNLFFSMGSPPHLPLFLRKNVLCWQGRRQQSCLRETKGGKNYRSVSTKYWQAVYLEEVLLLLWSKTLGWFAWHFKNIKLVAAYITDTFLCQRAPNDTLGKWMAPNFMLSEDSMWETKEHLHKNTWFIGTWKVKSEQS